MHPRPLARAAARPGARRRPNRASASCSTLLAALAVNACAGGSTGRGGDAVEAMYGARGDSAVGYRSILAGDGAAGPVDIGLWYPATGVAGEPERTTYAFDWKNANWETGEIPTVDGRAHRDAPIDTDRGPFPLVVFSHGFGANAVWYSDLLEHYASHGFVVLAPEHVESDWSESGAALITRPRDVSRAIDHAERLTGSGGELAGAVDTGRVAVVGHSYGGYTSLAAGGARMHLDAFHDTCAVLAEDDPRSYLCAPTLGRQPELANVAGLDEVPSGNWPSLADSRVDAVLPIARDAYVFDAAGLREVSVPMMAVGGTADTGTPYDWGAKRAFEGVAGRDRALVGLTGGEHALAFDDCADMPWTDGFAFAAFICDDPVWTKRRASSLIRHYSTAFLLHTLARDTGSVRALGRDGPTFDGVEFTTTFEPGRIVP